MKFGTDRVTMSEAARKLTTNELAEIARVAFGIRLTDDKRVMATANRANQQGTH